MTEIMTTIIIIAAIPLITDRESKFMSVFHKIGCKDKINFNTFFNLLQFLYEFFMMAVRDNTPDYGTSGIFAG